MRLPLISIIVPVYNVEKYLEQCVDSIVNQTYRNIEIILVDDGSTDNSSHICDQYKSRDDRIVVIHKSNGGISSARNYGLNICKGEFISFVDSDDWIDKKFIEILYTNATKSNADMSLASSLRVKSNGEITKWIQFEDEVISSEDFMKKTRSYSCWYKLYKRDLFSNIRFPEGRLGEDIYIAIESFCCAKKIVLSSTFLYYYRQNENSLTGSKSVKYYLDIPFAMKHLMQTIIDKKLGTEVLNCYFVNAFLWSASSLWYFHRKRMKVEKKIVKQNLSDIYALTKNDLSLFNKIKAKTPLIYMFIRRSIKHLLKLFRIK